MKFRISTLIVVTAAASLIYSFAFGNLVVSIGFLIIVVPNIIVWVIASKMTLNERA